jgi:hypothetical protein
MSRYSTSDVVHHGWCGAQHDSYTCTQPKGHDADKEVITHYECSLDGDTTYASWTETPIDLIQFKIRITAPAHDMSNQVMDKALEAVHGTRMQQRIADYIRERLRGADALEDFKVVVETIDE